MKQRSKKSLKLTDAVVRGAKNSYEFEVFPIQTEFEPQSAVYIFSERKVDKKGRGHQKFVSIGQTPSLDGEFAKYKKNFASKYNANVICVYIEENENSRLKIEDELKTAYSISCANNIAEKKIKVKPVKIPVPAAEAVQPKKQVSEPRKPTEKSVEKAVKATKKVKDEKTAVAPKPSEPKAEKVTSKVGSKKKTVKSLSSTGKKLKAESVKPAVRAQKPSKSKGKIQTGVKATKPTSKKAVKNIKPKRTTNVKNTKSNVKIVKTNGKSNGKTLKANGKTNGKQQPASNKKITAKNPTAGSKNRASKPTSRKQLAF